MSGTVSVLSRKAGAGVQLCSPVKNGDLAEATLLRGQPVRLIMSAHDDFTVGNALGNTWDHFFGVLDKELEYGDEISVGCVTQGPVYARVMGNAGATVGAWLCPVGSDAPNGPCFYLSVVPTGIRLLTDLTADLLLHTPDSLVAPQIQIDEGVPKNVVIWYSPAATDADGLHDGFLMDDVAAPRTILAAELTESELDTARNLIITPGKTNSGDVKAGNIVVTGLDIEGSTITETFTIAADNDATPLVGAKAFASITSVLVPIQDGNTATWDFGWGDILGFPYRLGAYAPAPIRTLLGNVVEGTVPVIAASATAIESNTIDLNSALDGTYVECDMPW